MTDDKPTQWKRKLWGAVSDYVGLVAVLIALIVVFSLTARNFFTVTTFTMITRQIPDTVIMAVGMTFVLIIAGIDLSVGSVLALSSVVLGVCMTHAKLPLPLAIAVCLGVGLFCGAINGLVTIAWRLPPFIVTLGMLEMARGGAYLVTNMQKVHIGTRIEVIADTSILGLSLPFVIAIAIVVIGQFVLSRTVFGRYMIAIGTNEEAVRLSGIDPRPVKLAVFMLCGFLTSIAAVTYSSRVPTADPNTGVGYELEAIAAVVIGGTSLMGGRGSVVASFFGVLIIRVLDAGLAQLGAPELAKRLITGCVIIVAVVADYYRRRLARARKEVRVTTDGGQGTREQGS